MFTSHGSRGHRFRNWTTGWWRFEDDVPKSKRLGRFWRVPCAFLPGMCPHLQFVFRSFFQHHHWWCRQEPRRRGVLSLVVLVLWGRDGPQGVELRRGGLARMEWGFRVTVRKVARLGSDIPRKVEQPYLLPIPYVPLQGLIRSLNLSWYLCDCDWTCDLATQPKTDDSWSPSSEKKRKTLLRFDCHMCVTAG